MGATTRDLALLRSCCNWASRGGYIEKTPFKRGTEAAVKLSRELPRSRRLEGDEGTRLLARCGRHLRALVEAALETIWRGAERVVRVSEAEIMAAMRHIFTDTHNLAEGAGAAPLAALLQERRAMAGKKVACVLSGGNIDRPLYARVISPA